MKRMDFLKEMGASLFQTVKYAYEPFARDDLQKVEEAADRALGIKWLPLMQEDDSAPKLDTKFVDGKPVIVSNFDTNMRVMNGICPVCSNIIVVTTLYSTGKCLNCEKEYNFKTQQGDLQLEPLPIKVKDKTVFIGLQKKLGGIHA
jgi:hypothetical protein